MLQVGVEGVSEVLHYALADVVREVGLPDPDQAGHDGNGHHQPDQPVQTVQIRRQEPRSPVWEQRRVEDLLDAGVVRVGRDEALAPEIVHRVQGESGAYATTGALGAGHARAEPLQPEGRPADGEDELDRSHPGTVFRLRPLGLRTKRPGCDPWDRTLGGHSLDGHGPGADVALSCAGVVHSVRVLPMERGAARRNCFEAVVATEEIARRRVTRAVDQYDQRDGKILNCTRGNIGGHIQCP